MRHWATILVLPAIVAAAVTVGCESDKPPEDTAEFDRDVDAAPTNLVVAPDWNLLADQSRLARQAAKTATATTQQATTAPAAGGEDASIAAVRPIVQQMLTDAKAGEMGKVFQLLGDQDRMELDETLRALAELPQTMAAFEKKVKERLEMKEVPASLTQGMGGGKGKPGLVNLEGLTMADLTFEKDGEAVKVIGPGTNFRFAKVDDQWQMALAPMEKKMLSVVGGLVKAQNKVLKTLNDGIDEGAVTEHNIDEKGMALLEELLKPEAEKLAQMMGDIMKEALSGALKDPNATPAPAPAPAP